MDYNKFSINLKKALAEKLPGLGVQKKMSPKGRENDMLKIPKDVKRSAVMLLLYLHENSFNLVFIRRAIDNGRHSGQIGFPGGGCENEDMNLLDTAKRETEEEIGVSGINILGKLSPIYISVSNYFVQPVVGILNYKPKFVKSIKEVSKVHSVSLIKVLDSKIVFKTFEINKHKITAPFYIYKDFDIWGATAMILAEFIEILNKSELFIEKK